MSARHDVLEVGADAAASVETAPPPAPVMDTDTSAEAAAELTLVPAVDPAALVHQAPEPPKKFWQWAITGANDQAPPVVYFIIGVFVVGIFVTSFLADPDVPYPNKLRMGAFGVALVLLLVVGLAAYGRSRSTKVASVVDALFLTFAVGVIAVAPVVTLAHADQVMLLKLTAIVVLALLPGLVYFQFLASRGEALWDEFTESLRRLDVDDYGPIPARGEVPDETNVYRRRFEATYGRLRPTMGLHSTRGRAAFPVYLLTVLVTVGWAAVLEPEPVGDGRIFSTLELSGAPGLSATALRFGFVGAYFFVFQMLVRRYFQNDLRADAYLNGVMRVVIAALGSATVAVVFPDLGEAQLAALAFMIGVFPQFAVDVIRTAVVFPVQSLVKGHDSRYPLSDLDGMNVWYEARLLEEGVEDMQNLKTASWVRLLLNTRIPPGRLVDWVDQSHLLLHVVPPQTGRRSTSERMADREQLRRYGIRTATDLEAAFYSSRADGETSMAAVLDDRNDDHRVVAILRTLAAEPVLRNVRAWKQQVEPAVLEPGVRLASVVRPALSGSVAP